MKSRLFIALAFLLVGIPLRAQWSGDADLSFGLGAMEGSIINEEKPMVHGLMKGLFRLNYQTEKLNWSTTVNAKWEPKTTDNSRMAYKDEKLNITYKAATTKPLSAGIKSELGWTPSRLRNYVGWIQYEYSNDRANNHSMNMEAGAENDSEKFSYYYEIPVMDKHKVETGLRTWRSFDSGRSILQSALTAQFIGSQKNNTWIVFKAGEGAGAGGGTVVNVDDVQGYGWKYRITPSSYDINLDGDIHLQRTLLEGETSLKLTPGVRLSVKHALDENSGATRINMIVGAQEEQWRDSTRLRESFNYLNVVAEPYLTAGFKWENLEAKADYACQVYARRLNDETHWQPLKIKGVYPVGKANFKWTISPMHSLNLTNQMSVSHPDYLKICWYDRTAGYLDQLYRGNESLRSPWTRIYGLEYLFNYKRFVSTTGVSYKRVVDEIDQTWSNEEIDGRQYKVFRWLNSADSRSLGITQKLGWRGKVITANAGITYNRSRRVAKSNGAVKDNFDWKLTGDISADLGKGWSMGADVKYQSKVATFFTIFKEYCQLNAFVQKEFKRFTLYLQGRDLLDTAMETSFESEEMQEYWIEEVRNNRRMLVLGAKWKF